MQKFWSFLYLFLCFSYTSPAIAQVTPWIGVGGGIGVSTSELESGGSAIDLAQEGALAGVSAGIDWKAQQLAMGIMARYSVMKLKGDFGSDSFESDGLWEVAFKLGVRPNDKVELYGLAGWSGIDLDPLSLGGRHPNGLMLGGGLEFALIGPWAGRLEYTWHDFKRESLGGPVTLDTDLHAVRAELVYRFNSQPTPFAPEVSKPCDPKFGNCRR